MAHNVFALCVVWVLKPFSTEMLLTMILCLIDICKAEINNFPEGAIFANALYFRPNYAKRVLVVERPTMLKDAAIVSTLFKFENEFVCLKNTVVFWGLVSYRMF